MRAAHLRQARRSAMAKVWSSARTTKHLKIVPCPLRLLACVPASSGETPPHVIRSARAVVRVRTGRFACLRHAITIKITAESLAAC